MNKSELLISWLWKTLAVSVKKLLDDKKSLKSWKWNKIKLLRGLKSFIPKMIHFYYR